MKYLLVSATTLEIQPILSEYNLIRDINPQLSCYQNANSRLDVLITGVGMVSTIYHLTKTLSSFDYDCVLNAGIAGCFDFEIPLGTVAHIRNDRFPELGAQDGEFLLSLVDLNLLEKNEFPFKDLSLVNERNISNPYISELPEMNAITVNTVHGNEKEIQKIRHHFNPDLESMEGAAFMYVCLQEKVSFAQIRSISNYVEPRNTEKWNIPLAISNLCEQLKKILTHD